MDMITLKGQAIRPYIPHLGKLRMTVFKEYPYLYEGELGYETDYLHTYVCCPESVMVVVFDKERVVGASTAIPLEYETPECQDPFLKAQMSISQVFYLGESVLLPEYRGRGIYKHFFQERETAARNYGSRMTAFCAVERAANDVRQPEGYKALDPVWHHFNYTKRPDLCAYYEWKEIGDTHQTTKPMPFWIKLL